MPPGVVADRAGTLIGSRGRGQMRPGDPERSHHEPADGVLIALAGDLFDDQPQHEVPGIAVPLLVPGVKFSAVDSAKPAT